MAGDWCRGPRRGGSRGPQVPRPLRVAPDARRSARPDAAENSPDLKQINTDKTHRLILSERSESRLVGARLDFSSDAILSNLGRTSKSVWFIGA